MAVEVEWSEPAEPRRNKIVVSAGLADSTTACATVRFSWPGCSFAADRAGLVRLSCGMANIEMVLPAALNSCASSRPFAALAGEMQCWRLSLSLQPDVQSLQPDV
jgi:hypothetical protein